MRRKQEEQINKRGFLSRKQIEKIKEIKRLKNYPIVDSSISSKVPHQLTLEEFTSVYSRSILERAAPALVDKSAKEIVFGRVYLVSLKDGISNFETVARKEYFKIIMKALMEKLPGIPEKTIEEVRFRHHFFKITRSYLKFYSEHYLSIL